MTSEGVMLCSDYPHELEAQFRGCAIYRARSEPASITA